jgi:hypothetical protein
MKFNYREAVERIVCDHEGHLLTQMDTVYRFPNQTNCDAAEAELKEKLPECRLFKTDDILVMTLPKT